VSATAEASVAAFVTVRGEGKGLRFSRHAKLKCVLGQVIDVVVVITRKLEDDLNIALVVR
jgi:hypothetical protein